METRNIVLNALNEELIPFEKLSWPHVIEHLVLSDPLLDYIPLHWHEAIQFTVVKKGTIQLHILGNKIIVPEGFGFFINSGVIHEIHTITTDASFICWNIGISFLGQHLQKQYVLPLILEKNLPYILLNPSKNSHAQMIKAILASYEAYYHKAHGFELCMAIQYLTCLGELLHVIPPDAAKHNPIYDQRVKDILAYIHNHYAEQIRLETLANVAHLSKAETNRVFKKHIGRTPFQYILDYRLERSINLLISTRSTITEIASECGFSSTSYFIDQFRKIFHLTPKKYRNERKAKRS